MRLLLSSALFWAGTHLCLMPQADCAGHSKARSKAPCHGQTGNAARCCQGLHLTEAGVPSSQILSCVPRAPHPAGLLSEEPEAAAHAAAVRSPQVSSAGPPLRPPPRESFGRSPPASA